MEFNHTYSPFNGFTGSINVTDGMVFLLDKTTSFEKEQKNDHHLSVYGYPGANFYIVHISALISLGISTIISTGVLLYLSTNLWSKSVGKVNLIFMFPVDQFIRIDNYIKFTYSTKIKWIGYFEYLPDLL